MLTHYYICIYISVKATLLIYYRRYNCYCHMFHSVCHVCHVLSGHIDINTSVVVQVVPLSKCPPGHSALVQDVPRTICPRAECPQRTLYPTAWGHSALWADCPP